MKQSATLFLQIVLVLIGISAAAALLWEPHLEGRNTQATVWEVYFHDPFLLFVYAGSIPFFAGLYQAINVLGYIRHNLVFSPKTVSALRTIKFCAMSTVAIIVVAGVYLRITAARNDDDPAGALMLGIIAIGISIVVAVAAGIFEKIIQRAVHLQSENDLTV